MTSTETEQTTKRLPFHEALVEVIRGASPVEMAQLALILRAVSIPEDHDVISEAWQTRVEHWRKRSRWTWKNHDLGVAADLAAQKEVAEEKAAKKAEEAEKPLFPAYLNQGSKGLAVNVLGLILRAMGYGSPDRIVLDGDYTPNGEVAEAVRDFQRQAGFTGDAVDGNFGPATRAELKAIHGIDVDKLTRGMFSGETVGVGPEDAPEEGEAS